MLKTRKVRKMNNSCCCTTMAEITWVTPIAHCIPTVSPLYPYCIPLYPHCIITVSHCIHEIHLLLLETFPEAFVLGLGGVCDCGTPWTFHLTFWVCTKSFEFIFIVLHVDVGRCTVHTVNEKNHISNKAPVILSLNIREITC